MMRTLHARRNRVLLFLFVLGFAVAVQIAQGQQPQESRSVYVLRPHDKSVVIPEKLNGFPVKIIDAIPEPPSATPKPMPLEELQKELAPPPALQMTSADRKLLLEINPRLSRKPMPAPAPTASDCSNHEVIGTLLPGTPLQPTDTVGTWVSMPIAENGIPSLNGTLFTTFSNIAAQTLEVIGNYCSGSGCAPNTALLSVYDWSCVDNKEGDPTLASCQSQNNFMYGKAEADIASQYKFYYWDCCKWQKAFALANKSHYVHLLTKVPPPAGGPNVESVYVNEAKILNWETLKWETFYSRIFQNRDAQPPRSWGPIASLEFAATPCPNIPRLGYREVRYLPAGGVWTLATPTNTTMRFDLPDDYRYCLFDPNHTWCACLK